MELIKITKKEGQQLVSARELYVFLQIGKDFTSWCKSMFEYGFDENKDYTLTKSGEPNSQGFVNPNPKIDYALTLDCAKEIAMIQRTDKGKQARQYFIECEKQLKGKVISLPDYPEALRQLAQSIELNDKLQQEIIIQAPKVAFFNAVADSKDAIDIGEAAKILNIGIGRNRLFELLRTKKILMEKNQPYQKYIDMGWFRVVEQSYQKPDGSTHISIKTLVYNKGLQEILKLAM